MDDEERTALDEWHRVQLRLAQGRLEQMQTDLKKLAELFADLRIEANEQGTRIGGYTPNELACTVDRLNRMYGEAFSVGLVAALMVEALGEQGRKVAL